MRKIAMLFLFLGLFFGAKADEGMWLLSRLKGETIRKMQKEGCKLSAQDIYDINNSSIKDAIVGLGNGATPTMHFCTAEIISGEGLLLTNHHCGYSAIQAHSSLEHNYLRDGFWAFKKNEELTNPGTSASILHHMEDVTERVTSCLNSEMSEAARKHAIDSVSAKISAEAMPKESHLFAHVTSIFDGNQFFLFVYTVYQDVRLVAAPPEGMGKFGGDTDNWMWPRHTADFSMLRIYTAPDGTPAPYSPENIPLKPKHSLPVSASGIKDGDFAMILGFPARTNRFATSYALKYTMENINNVRYNVRTQKLNVLWAAMEKDTEIRIKYAAKASQSSNYWKNAYEQNKALKKLHTMDNKLAIEKDFNQWLAANPEMQKLYGQALPLIKTGYENIQETDLAINYLNEAIIQGAEVPKFAVMLERLLNRLCAEKTSPEEKQELLNTLQDNATLFYKDIDTNVDIELFKTLYKYYKENVSDKYLPATYKVIDEQYNGDIDKFADYAYKTSIFSTQEALSQFLQNPDKVTLSKDPLLLAGKYAQAITGQLYGQIADNNVAISKGNRLFVAGLLAMNPGAAIAPNANSTLRLTYGNVKSYSPKDGVEYSYKTSLKGVMEKEDSTSYEFTIPERLRELYNAKAFGSYADKNGDLAVNFITTNDITGGNSGSPVINAKGELIGVAFDGNSEAMSGDLDFEENLQRCIALDTRYMLWIVDVYAGAKNLINEMNIVR